MKTVNTCFVVKEAMRALVESINPVGVYTGAQPLFYLRAYLLPQHKPHTLNLFFATFITAHVFLLSP